MSINKVEYGDETLIDLTNDTVTEDDVLKGVTFHAANGEEKTGKVVVAPIIDTIEEVLSASKEEGKVVNAFTVAEFSNVYTECVGAILQEGKNTVGTWFAEGETWIVDSQHMIVDPRFIEHNGEQLSFQFDFWVGEAQGTNLKANSTPIHITGYQWDSTNGGLTIRCAETAPNDITVLVKVTHIREKV